MESINITALQEKMRKFAQERDWEQFHSPKNLVMALSVECAELVEHFQWLTEKESFEVKDNQELKQKVSDEISDVFVYLMRLCDRLEIPLEESVHQKMKKNAEKYPVEKAKGSAKKYTEL